MPPRSTASGSGSAGPGRLLAPPTAGAGRTGPPPGREPAAVMWSAAADELRVALLDHLWTGDGFVACGPISQQRWSTSSLLLPGADRSGRELPAEVSAILAERIEKHLTPYGLATELPTSSHYRSDGYLAGPGVGSSHGPRRGRIAPQRPCSSRRRDQRLLPGLVRS